MKRIVIVVNGGVVQSVYGPKGFEVELLDYDNAETHKLLNEMVELENKVLEDETLYTIF